MACVRFHLNVLLPRLCAYRITSNRPPAYYLLNSYLFDGRGARFIPGRELTMFIVISLLLLRLLFAYHSARVRDRCAY